MKQTALPPLDFLPMGQSSQAVSPSSAAILPRLHGVQEVLADSGVIFPTGHLTQISDVSPMNVGVRLQYSVQYESSLNLNPQQHVNPVCISVRRKAQHS